MRPQFASKMNGSIRIDSNALRRRAGALVCILAMALTSVPNAHADGASVYKAKCSTCHDSGAGEAPRTAVAADWTERFAAGRAALHAAAIHGIPNTAMAPKGGFAELSDDEVRAAVDYMLALTGYVDRVAGGMALAQASARAASPARASAVEGTVADDELLRRVAVALRDVIAPPDTPIEPHGGELSIQGTGVRVGINAGVVRLMGVAAHAATIKRAEEAVRRVAGVRRVDNKLISGGMLDFD